LTARCDRGGRHPGSSHEEIGVELMSHLVNLMHPPAFSLLPVLRLSGTLGKLSGSPLNSRPNAVQLLPPLRWNHFGFRHQEA
jgi:hypothetical protein